MEEIEYTYLARRIPESLGQCARKEIIDAYILSDRTPLSLRIRKSGEKREITKKEPLDENNISEQIEQTISLTPLEYNSLMQSQTNIVRKIRYFYPYKELQLEVDVFQDALLGLVVIEAEFESRTSRDAFVMPDFCLAEITNEHFIAGGALAGTSYADIEPELARFNYHPLSL